MAVTQESRYRMHQRLEEVLGDEPATTLMEHLPPTGWADMATKQDVAHATELLSQRIDAVDEKLSARIDQLDEKWAASDAKWNERFDHQNAAFTARFEAIEKTMATKEDLANRQTDMHKTLLTVGGVIVATNVAMFGSMLGFVIAR